MQGVPYLLLYTCHLCGVLSSSQDAEYNGTHARDGCSAFAATQRADEEQCHEKGLPGTMIS